ncbi:MAG: thioredoxin [Bacteroidales bacterium]|jgi:thioredoxin|nr:thioredoxin [Bacteroidales bacterium]
MQKIYLILVVIVYSIFNNNIYSQTTQPTKVESEETIEIVHLTKETFKELIWNFEANPKNWTFEGDLPCIIDFYANWCGPCRQLAPKLAELAEEYKGQIVIYKINTDQEKELAAIFGVRSIPAILFVPSNSQQPQMALGNLPKETLVEAINNVLLQKNNK